MSEPTPLPSLPLLPLKRNILFPGVLMPLSVGRSRSVASVEAAVGTEEKELLVFAQKDPAREEVQQSDLYSIGTKAVIKRMARPKEDLIELIVQGVERVVLVKVEQDPERSHLEARYRSAPLPEEKGPEIEALHRAVLDLAVKALNLARPQGGAELSQMVSTTEDPLQLVYLIGSMLSLDLEKEQALLEAPAVSDALRLIHTYLSYEVQVLELRQKISSQAQSEMGKEQREYLLRQQLRAIQQELGEENPAQAEMRLLKERIEEANLPEEVRKEVERELSRLERLPAAAPDYNVIRSYLELVVELPWNKESEERLDIAFARRVLDEDHYDLEEVKERILEQLGVLKMNPSAKAPILCFVGPPGVGKTSLGQSIARALGREFERMSLGGLHDEAELRGHRRTYIGAMPGRIIQAVRRSGVRNPVLMLDEIDKLGRDFRGDPASALLEILDPEQNKNFRDNFLDLPFDLSKVLFIGTANTLETIPRPLLDRMELLRLAGYSEEEKLAIARQYLIPRQLKEAGLSEENCRFEEESLQQVIRRYTREAGLRQLERTIGRLARKVALRFAEGNTDPVVIRKDDLGEMLGPESFFLEERRSDLPPGVAVGLAWTESGGEVLYVEATRLPEGKGLTLTGQLGEVMQESARAAQSYIRSHAEELGIDASLFRDSGVHIHVPAGAIRKDGPSAGVTIATALASLYSGRPMRTDTAMTGEITLTGLVMPVGGIKEKVLAGRRAGISRVVLPKGNEKDLKEIPEHVREEMEILFAERIEEVLAQAVPDLAERPASAPSL